MGSQAGTKGMLPQRAAGKSLMGTLIDLYKADLAFRGMVDFACHWFHYHDVPAPTADRRLVGRRRDTDAFR